MTHLRLILPMLGITPTVVRRLRVLLAYDPSDIEAVRNLSAHLAGDGFGPWLDEDDEPPHRHTETSKRNIRDAEAVVVCLSRHTTLRGENLPGTVRAALELAAKAWRIPLYLFLFRLDRADIPEQLVEFGGVDATDNYSLLLELLRERARMVGAMTGGANRPFEYSGLMGVDGKPLTSAALDRSRIVFDVGRVNAHILDDLRLHPARWHDLSPSKFEEIVAELLTTQGYYVVRTPFSKDGGFDLYAARKDGLGEFLYLVECKRYTPPHKVGVNVARSLLGVLDDRRATAAAIVTTSYFTAGAHALQRRNTYQLKFHDYEVLQQWLAQRQGVRSN